MDDLSCGKDLILYYRQVFGLEAFANDRFKVAKMMVSVLDRVENVGKEKMLVTSIFSFSLNVFQKLHPKGSLKVGIV